MSEPVKPRRRYDSRRRQEQAAGTRARILEAAQELFERDGYVATTIAAVADAAGVALKTVYLVFETKSGLLRAVWDLLLRGPVDQPVSELAWYREVLEEPDSRRMLELNARNSRRVKERIGGLLRVIRDASGADNDMADLWHVIETDFHANQRAIVVALAGRGGLAPGLDVERATDILWTLNHPDVWRLLVGVRGWTADEYERWFAAASGEQLLGPPGG